MWLRNKESHPPQAAEGYGQPPQPSLSFRDAPQGQARNP